MAAGLLQFVLDQTRFLHLGSHLLFCFHIEDGWRDVTAFALGVGKKTGYLFRACLVRTIVLQSMHSQSFGMRVAWFMSMSVCFYVSHSLPFRLVQGTGRIAGHVRS